MIETLHTVELWIVESSRRRDQYPVSLSYSNYILAEVGDIYYISPSPAVTC